MATGLISTPYASTEGLSPLLRDRCAIAYTTFAQISRIFSRLTAPIVATLTLSRFAGERASTVDRCPQPRMIVHQSSGVLSGCVPGSATTTGSLTPHSTRRARSGSGSTILFQGLIDLNSSGSAWRTASQNLPSAGSNILGPQIVIAR